MSSLCHFCAFAQFGVLWVQRYKNGKVRTESSCRIHYPKIIENDIAQTCNKRRILVDHSTKQLIRIGCIVHDFNSMNSNPNFIFEQYFVLICLQYDIYLTVFSIQSLKMYLNWIKCFIRTLRRATVGMIPWTVKNTNMTTGQEPTQIN